MAFSSVYARQVALLIKVLPFVAEEDCFALKGGTAINLFLRDMPRLSVDIDLAYLPIAPRDQSLRDIDGALRRIAARIKTGLPGAKINETPLRNDGRIYKLIVAHDRTQITIEITPVLRGCVFDTETRAVSPTVERVYGFAEISTLSFADLYGGKIVAALDRQHPRDLFDIHGLLANEGVDHRLRQAFVVYLISHNRPTHEVLDARLKDVTKEFNRGFRGMTRDPVDLSVLLDARAQLIQEIILRMPDDHRNFLMSFERGDPDWSQLNVDGAAKLPAVEWRIQNLGQLGDRHRSHLVAALERILSRS